MKVFAIIGHQNKNKDSFCHAIAQTVVQSLQSGGHEVIYHDLYDEQFDPILPHDEIKKGSPRDAAVQRYCQQATAADALRPPASRVPLQHERARPAGSRPAARGAADQRAQGQGGDRDRGRASRRPGARRGRRR